MYPGTRAEVTPDKPAIVMAATGEVVTYRQLDDESNRLAQFLRAAGLGPGDHIALMLENHPMLLVVAWAAVRSGLYYTAISNRLTAEEAVYIVNDCEATVFIASAATADVAEAVVAETPMVTIRLMLDKATEHFEPYETAVAGSPAERLPDEREGLDMLYSSGTTGQPKGIKPPLPEGDMGTVGPGPGLTLLCQMIFGFEPDMVYLSTAPLYHAAPLRFSLATHRTGGTVVVMEHWDPLDTLRFIERYRVTHAQFVPTMFIRMLKLSAEERSRFDLSSLRYAIHAAAPCPVPVKRQMLEWLGPVVHEYYAGTEANGLTHCSPEDWLTHPGSVGKQLVGVVHILDEAGDEVAPGHTGTVYFESPTRFEYHNDPDKTEGSRDARGRGWTTLGDIGHVDEDGFLYLTDRKAYVIITGGLNVYPQEVENLLAVHPKVADVAVFGVPNDELGEEVKAVVQPVDVDEAGPSFEKELIAYCRQHLSQVKCPRSVDFEDELPRHPTGKLYKRLLRDRYWSGHDSKII
jgi:acyl-CoA synthetase (AMP-forming)/AMP-acid ligase II